MEIVVIGSGVRAALDEDLVAELVARLEGFGASDTGQRLRSRHSILREDVPVVREVLGRWQHASGTAELDDELRELRNTLARLQSQRPPAHEG